MSRAKIAALLFAFGCSATPLGAHLVTAQNFESAHDDAGALREYEIVLRRCPVVNPGRDDCGSAAMRAAELHEQNAQWQLALERWLSVPHLSSDRRKHARALVRAARVDADHLGNRSAAEALDWQTIESYPNEVGADDALKMLEELVTPEQTSAFERRLAQLYEKFGNEDIGDNLLLARADAAHVGRHDSKAALALYDELARRYEHSSLRDEALFTAANMLYEDKDYAGAIAHLKTLLATKRDAWIVGSYNSVYLDDAQLMLGKIYRDDLHDDEKAIRAFTDLATKFKTSTLRDDALWELAQTELHAAKPASQSRACAALKTLLAKFPDSNQTRHATDLAARLDCR